MSNKSIPGPSSPVWKPIGSVGYFFGHPLEGPGILSIHEYARNALTQSLGFCGILGMVCSPCIIRHTYVRHRKTAFKDMWARNGICFTKTAQCSDSA